MHCFYQWLCNYQYYGALFLNISYLEGYLTDEACEAEAGGGETGEREVLAEDLKLVSYGFWLTESKNKKRLRFAVILIVCVSKHFHLASKIGF